ncbi:MAG: radical SAM family heme chaperone HemW [Verrucomicrobia bacterium]|nr:MAG: radical SAM family heme chaperone HemW [Verrucomicrobiota bacterium]
MALANIIPTALPDYNVSDFAPDNLGIYVHGPFCAHTCDFCAFYQEEPRREDILRYLETIDREMALVPPEPAETAFWGGGTPGLLAAGDLERLGRIQLRHFGAPRREWSIELAPGSVKADKLGVLRDLGFTRVSLGVQSFSEKLLERLGRRHSPAQIRRAWELLRGAGFASINIDLMFALPGQSLEAWRDDLRAAIALEPDHLSTYCLTFEEDTALFVQLSEGKVRQDDERDRAFYETTWEMLGEAGFEHYEISNYARPGHRCLHNINTWRMHRWHGFGPSAASQGRDWRGTNPHDLRAWSDDVAHGRRATQERTLLTAAQLVEDALIFGLRMNEGVRLADLAERFGAAALAPFRPVLAALVADGLLEHDPEGDVVRLTREGRLLADAVGEALLGAGENRTG